MSSWSSLTSGDAYRSPAFIALVSALSVAVLVLLHHCVVAHCWQGGAAERRRRRQHHHRHVVSVVTTSSADARQHGEQEDDGDGSISVEVSATSRTHLVAAAVVCRYRKEEPWNESTCPVCLADFEDGEPVRVLPECMHYFHAECIDTWLRGSTSCPMCRAKTTPTPSPSPATMHPRGDPRQDVADAGGGGCGGARDRMRRKGKQSAGCSASVCMHLL